MPIRHLPFTAVLFDLDNTLMNTEEFYTQALHYIYNKHLKHFLRIVSWDSFLKVYNLARLYTHSNLKNTGSSHSRLLYFQRAFELLGAPVNLSLLYKIYEEYWTYVINESQVYPGIIDLLKLLEQSHVRTALVSDSLSFIQIKKLVAEKLSYLIDVIVTSEEASKDKPAIDQFLYAMHKLEALSAETIMIGNNPDTDIAGGINAGIPTVLVDYYNKYNINELEIKPTFYINNINSLYPILALDNYKLNKNKYVIVWDSSLIWPSWRDFFYQQSINNKFSKDLKINVAIKQLALGYLSELQFWQKLGYDAKSGRQMIISWLLKNQNKGILKLMSYNNMSSHKIEHVVYTDMPSVWLSLLLNNNDFKNNVTIINTSDYIGIPKYTIEGYYLLINKNSNVPTENYMFFTNKLDMLRPLRFWENMKKVLVVGSNKLSVTFKSVNQTLSIPNYVVTSNVNEIANIISVHIHK